MNAVDDRVNEHHRLASAAAFLQIRNDSAASGQQKRDTDRYRRREFRLIHSIPRRNATQRT
jgi:hypothetical protein